MKNELERNAKILNELENVGIDLDDSLSEMEIAVEKDLEEGVSAYIPVTDTLDSKQTLSGKMSEDAVEKSKREVSDLINEEKAKLEKIALIGANYLYFGEGEVDTTEEVRIQVGELFGKLQDGLLTTKEFNKLASLTAQMNFNEMLRNTVDLIVTVHINNINMLSSVQDKKIIPIFKPIYSKFVEKFKLFKINHEQNLDDQLDGLALEKEENTKKMNFTIDQANEFMFDIIKDDDFDEKVAKEFSLDDFENLIDRNMECHNNFRTIEEKCAVTLMENGFYDLDELQTKESAWNGFSTSLFECIQKYQIKHLKDNYEVVRKYYVETTENGILVCKVGDKLCNISKENMVDDMVALSEIIMEYENGLEDNKLQENEIQPLEDGVLEQPLSTEPVLEANILGETTPEALEEKELENESTIDPVIKDTYIDLMSSIYGEEEANNLALNDENIKAFEESSYSPNKYLEAIEEGTVADTVSYGEFVYNELEKDLDKSKEDEEIDYELEQKLANAKHAKANILEGNDIKSDDISGIDVSVFEEDPMSFSNEEPVLTSDQAKKR